MIRLNAFTNKYWDAQIYIYWHKREKQSWSPNVKPYSIAETVRLLFVTLLSWTDSIIKKIFHFCLSFFWNLLCLKIIAWFMPLIADNWTGHDKNSNYRFDRTSLANNTSAFKCQKSKIWTKTKNVWYQNYSGVEIRKKSRLRLWWQILSKYLTQKLLKIFLMEASKN